jgi:hypothetical protein
MFVIVPYPTRPLPLIHGWMMALLLSFLLLGCLIVGIPYALRPA